VHEIPPFVCEVRAGLSLLLPLGRGVERSFSKNHQSEDGPGKEDDHKEDELSEEL
jgi:hypothetical protein